MNLQTRVFALLVVGLSCSNAFAVKQLVYVQPNDSTFRVENRDDGTTRFTITRDPALARLPANSDLQILRSAYVRVHDGKQLVYAGPVAAGTNRDGHLVYRFDVQTKYAEGCRFTLSEIEERKTSKGYMGGGTIFEHSIGAPEFLQEAIDSITKDQDTSP